MLGRLVKELEQRELLMSFPVFAEIAENEWLRSNHPDWKLKCRACCIGFAGAMANCMA
jgi:hypothetical protein